MDQSIYAEIAANIRKYRELNKLTQAAMAEKINLDHQYYAQLEQGRRNFTIEKVIDSCNVLHIQIEDVIPKIAADDSDESERERKALLNEIFAKLKNASTKDLRLVDKFIDDFVSMM